MNSAPRRVVAVIPSRGHDVLLAGALDALGAQDVPIAEVVVVDDSVDGSLALDRDVTLLHSGGTGPYAARELAWRSVDAEIYLFLDARSRPLPTWAGSLTALFARPEVSIGGSDIQVLGGSSPAARAAALEQPFRVSAYVDEPWFMSYIPTCNMAVRRSALESVGGFSAVRSGGDADLCWRIQLGGGRLAVVPSVQMEWIPRTDIRSYLEQHYRYGMSRYTLSRAWLDRGASPAPVVTLPQIGRRAVALTAKLGWAALRLRRDRILWQLVEAGRIATRLGTWRAARQTAG
jgi:cellulose synthase/poly-beta-1,6-N-acetylglucosamine synthase-like glycosyltransferase